jgi:hypothetical protein
MDRGFSQSLAFCRYSSSHPRSSHSATCTGPSAALPLGSVVMYGKRWRAAATRGSVTPARKAIEGLSHSRTRESTWPSQAMYRFAARPGDLRAQRGLRDLLLLCCLDVVHGHGRVPGQLAHQGQHHGEHVIVARTVTATLVAILEIRSHQARAVTDDIAACAVLHAPATAGPRQGSPALQRANLARIFIWCAGSIDPCKCCAGPEAGPGAGTNVGPQRPPALQSASSPARAPATSLAAVTARFRLTTCRSGSQDQGSHRWEVHPRGRRTARSSGRPV